MSDKKIQIKFGLEYEPRIQLDGSKPEPKRIYSSALRLFDIDELKEMHVKCKGCELHENRKQAVFSSGPINSKVIFFGEALGKNENKKSNIDKSPFVGASGKYFNRKLEEIGLDRNLFYVSNVVKDWPLKNATPEINHINQCKFFWQEEIKLVRPRIIVTLGATALYTLTEGRHKSVSKARNMQLKYNGIPLVVANHPAGVLRNLEELEVFFENALLRVKDYV